MNSLYAGILMVSIGIFMSLGIKVGTNLPGHALLLVDTRTERYVTAPCILRNTVDQSYVANLSAVIEGTEEVWYEPFVEPMTKTEANALGMRPDRTCANADGFVHLQPWLWAWLGWTKERVEADGTVLW